MRKLSWILLTVVGALTLLASLVSAGLAYGGNNYPTGGVPVVEVAAGRPGLEAALRGVRGTSAAYAASYSVLFLFVVLGPYRRGERWAWWALLAALMSLVILTMLRVPTLGVLMGVGAPAIQGGLVLLALLLDVGRLKKGLTRGLKFDPISRDDEPCTVPDRDAALGGKRRMPHQLVEGLKRFRREYFPMFREHYQRLVTDGQRPSTLFLGCADSRVVPDLLTNALPGDLFVLRNIGAFVPPFEPDAGFHGTSAGIEFATLMLEVKDIVVCGHSDCGAIRALFSPLRADAPHITRWLELARRAADGLEFNEANLRRAEMRSIVLQLERLLTFPMVRERVERGDLCLHGWYYVIEEGRVLGLDAASGEFRPLS